ncbi:MAG: DUF4338 domain-containing protein [Magnetococcales bacterium]|nr:DUF4338 domain-containing protein [Magnetococcales bacterium]
MLIGTKADSRLWNEYIQRYHYLGHKPLPGAQLRTSSSLPVGSWLLSVSAQLPGRQPLETVSSAGPQEQRKRNLPLIVNNARFLILPWIRSHNLASMILAKVAKTLPDHWWSVYNVRPVLMETFVEKPRFQGTCYHAANWIHLGETKGRGKLGPHGILGVPVKDIWIYPMNQNFKMLLCQ